MPKDYIRKKPIISGTISPHHKKKIEKLINEGEFASISDFMNQAVSDYLKKYDKQDDKPDFYDFFSESELLLLKNIVRDKSDEMESMNQPMKGKDDQQS